MPNRFAAETYHGKPCPHCGGTERYRSNQSCIRNTDRQHKLERRRKQRAKLRKQEFLR